VAAAGTGMPLASSNCAQKAIPAPGGALWQTSKHA
jgi:hypothetical protein